MTATVKTSTVYGVTDLLFVTDDSESFALDTEAIRRGGAALTRAEDREIHAAIVESLDKTGALPFALNPQLVFFLKHHPERTIEYLIYRYKMDVFPFNKRVPDFPVYLLIEPSSACNLRCVMCFQIDQTFTKKPFMGVMDFDLFKKVVDEAAEGGTKALTFASRGEPTMNKRLGEMLRYARDKGAFLDIKLNTNGTFLDEKMCHDVLANGCNLIVISIDSVDAEHYGKVRVGGHFDEVLENVRRLKTIRDTHYADKGIEIRVAGVKVDETQDAVAFGAFWQPYCDTVAMQPMQERWDTYANAVHPQLTHPCEILWSRIYVWYDGTCNPCDVDYKSALKLGNARESSIREIWHGEPMKSMRREHLLGNRKAFMPCDRCGL